MKTTILKNKWMHFALALSLMGALVPPAGAESFSVQVPFEFMAGSKSLPAGTYTVDPIATGILIIRGSAESVAVATSPSSNAGVSAKPSLSFDRSSDLAMLSSVRMDSGLTFTLLPVKRLTATIAVPAKGGVLLAHP